MGLEGDHACSGRLDKPRPQKGRTGRRCAEGNAILAKLCLQGLVIPQSVLQGQRESVGGKALCQLFCSSLCLPGFNQHDGLFETLAIAGLFDHAHVERLFPPLRIHQPRALLMKRLDAGLPAAQQGNSVPSPRQPPREQRGERARPDDQYVHGDSRPS